MESIDELILENQVVIMSILERLSEYKGSLQKQIAETREFIRLEKVYEREGLHGR